MRADERVGPPRAGRAPTLPHLVAASDARCHGAEELDRKRVAPPHGKGSDAGCRRCVP